LKRIVSSTFKKVATFRTAGAAIDKDALAMIQMISSKQVNALET